ncbi:polymer-forming cytoskeletal protein [Paenibacillus sp. GCM10012306]|uniref:polymer-forming cytoskeletal protein n=1 Tax=Paenibacillus sp. GCM10012306 TaxID=3317342 RepID=UPI0036161248
MSDKTTLSNLSMVGTSTSGGGSFLNVKVTGECQFNDAVDCRRLSLTGNVRVDGDLQAEKLKVTGELAVAGGLAGQSLRGTGEVKAASARIEHIDFSGSLVVNGDCEAEQLQISGAAEVEGLLSAERLQINLFGPGSAREVGGGTVVIKQNKAGKLLNFIKAKQDVIFRAGLIEGDNIELHCTVADTVRGGSVIIGPDCVIQTVEYRETLEIHKNASVKQQVRI